MIPQKLEQLFHNYLATVAFSHSREMEEKIQTASSNLLVDVFAYLPDLQTWVLCWSVSTPNTANRVFIKDTHNAFKATTKPGASTSHHSHKIFSRDTTHEHDLALLALHNNHDTVAIVPIFESGSKCIGAIRLIGSEQDLNRHGYAKGRSGYDCSKSVRGKLKLPDRDLLAHILGRWAGSGMGGRGEKQVTERLLECFCYFFETSHSMYYRRDFGTDILTFFSSSTDGTEKIVKGLSAGIHDHTYMFSIIAERGAAEIVDDFPEDLAEDLRLNCSDWTPDETYSKLQQKLNCKETSYIGIPLKVDDAVLGVFSILTKRGQGEFDEGARFMRSTLSEMGRTIDKRAMTRSTSVLRTLRSSSEEVAPMRASLSALAKKLVTNLVSEIVPFGKLEVNFIEARLEGATESIGGLPRSVSDYLKRSVADLVLIGSVALFIASEKTPDEPLRGVIAVPITAALPFVIYVYGPVALLTGRTLRTALEQVQATFNLALAASENTTDSQIHLTNQRGYLALWAKIHDIKNRTAGFARPVGQLVRTAENGNLEDLKSQIYEFKNSFSATVEDFEIECSEILRGSYFRSVKDTPLINVLRQSVNVVMQFPNLRGKVKFIGHGPLSTNIKTYSSELELVLRDLIRNILQHFERRKQEGDVIIECKKIGSSQVAIILSDTISEPGSAAKVTGNLEDSESRTSLRRHIKPTVERLLQGEIRAERNLEYDSLSIILTLPIEVVPH